MRSGSGFACRGFIREASFPAGARRAGLTVPSCGYGRGTSCLPVRTDLPARGILQLIASDEFIVRFLILFLNLIIPGTNLNHKAIPLLIHGLEKRAQLRPLIPSDKTVPQIQIHHIGLKGNLRGLQQGIFNGSLLHHLFQYTAFIQSPDCLRIILGGQGILCFQRNRIPDFRKKLLLQLILHTFDIFMFNRPCSRYVYGDRRAFTRGGHLNYLSILINSRQLCINPYMVKYLKELHSDPTPPSKRQEAPLPAPCG